MMLYAMVTRLPGHRYDRTSITSQLTFALIASHVGHEYACLIILPVGPEMIGLPVDPKLEEDQSTGAESECRYCTYQLYNSRDVGCTNYKGTPDRVY